MYSTQFDEDEIEIKANGETIAKFVDGGNGMEGKIEEFDEPARMLPTQMIELAKWLLSKANERVGRLED